MDRIEVLPCVFRATDRSIQEVEFPKAEPQPHAVAADLYCGSYAVRKGLFGSARIENLEVTVFNTRDYRRDAELEEAAKDRLVNAILAREDAELVSAAGGAEALRQRVRVTTFWRGGP